MGPEQSAARRALDQLRSHYVARLDEQLPRLRELLENAQGASDPSGAELRQLAHRLKGSGKTYGFAEISNAASSLEDAIDTDQEFHSQGASLVEACVTALTADTAHRPADAVETPRPEIRTESQALQVPSVLLVEDDEDMLALLRSILADDATLIEVNTAADALESLRKQSPDILLLDNALASGTTGIEFLEAHSDDPLLQATQVIMLTANDEPEIIMRALVAGAVDYLRKPLEVDAVTGTLRSRLRKLQKPILIADDDPSVRELLELLFRNAGYRVIPAVDGVDAMDLLSQSEPALAVLDRMMPGIDGLAIMNRLQQKGSDIPVVFLTAKQAPSDVLEGLNRGAADYVTKPFSPEELLARCERILASDDQ